MLQLCCPFLLHSKIVKININTCRVNIIALETCNKQIGKGHLRSGEPMPNTADPFRVILEFRLALVLDFCLGIEIDPIYLLPPRLF